MVERRVAPTREHAEPGGEDVVEVAVIPELGGADAVVFTGGIGENSAEIRARICRGLEWLGLELDPARNTTLASGAQGMVSTDSSRLAAWVIPTDEELLIAHDTARVVTTGDPRTR